MAIERAPRQYVALRGSHINNSDAEVVGPELEVLAAQGDGITPASVVARAATPGTALNAWDSQKGYFEWNDVSAAEAYREGQARRLIKAVVIRVDDGQSTHRVPAYYSVTRDDSARRYESVDTLMENPEYVRQVRDRFTNELIRIDQSYRAFLAYRDFAADHTAVFEAIDADIEATATPEQRARRRQSRKSKKSKAVVG